MEEIWIGDMKSDDSSNSNHEVAVKSLTNWQWWTGL